MNLCPCGMGGMNGEQELRNDEENLTEEKARTKSLTVCHKKSFCLISGCIFLYQHCEKIHKVILVSQMR